MKISAINRINSAITAIEDSKLEDDQNRKDTYIEIASMNLSIALDSLKELQEKLNKL